MDQVYYWTGFVVVNGALLLLALATVFYLGLYVLHLIRVQRIYRHPVVGNHMHGKSLPLTVWFNEAWDDMLDGANFNTTIGEYRFPLLSAATDDGYYEERDEAPQRDY